MVRQFMSETPDDRAIVCRTDTAGVDRRMGMQLGKYRVGNLIGTGGTGTVYEAEDTFLKRRVAIKVLPDVLARDAQAIRRFVLEARAFARVNHPNAVLIFEVNRREGICYLVMELMRGGSMQDLLNTAGALKWPQATQAVLDACRALVATHAAGLIHRDIKPGNLMCSSGGLVKLADFGLAKDAGVSLATYGHGSKVVGTPHYMSPEQCRGERVDQRGDVYSLGATYYALLTGRPPYHGELPLQVLFAHCSADVPDPRDVDRQIPSVCAAIVQRCMAKEPSARYQSAAELLADLELALSEGPVGMADVGAAAAASGDMLGDLAQALSTTQLAARALADLRPSTGRRWPRRGSILLAILLSLIVGGGAWLVFRLRPHAVPSGSSQAVAPIAGLRSAGDAPRPPSHARVSVPQALQPKPFGGRVTAEGLELDVAEKADALAFSCDAARLAVGSAQGIQLWNVASGLAAGTPWRAKGARELRFSPLSPWKQTLVAAESVGLVVRDGRTAWERMPFGADTLGPVRCVALSRDGRLLAAAVGKDPNHQAIRVWEMANGRDAGGPRSYSGCITALDFSPDGKLLAAATNDGAILWETAAWKPVIALLSSSPAKAVAFSPDGKMLAVGDGAGAYLWDVHSWAGKSKLPGALTCLAFTPDGKVLALGQSDGTVQCWDVAAGKRCGTLPKQSGPVTALAFLPKTRIVAVGGAAKTVRLFDLSKSPSLGGATGVARLPD
jgi:hypothetical protein